MKSSFLLSAKIYFYMKTRHFLYPLLFLLSVAMSASSCSLFIPQERDIKEGSAFYAVDLLEIEKLKGEEMLFSDLIESLEIIKLDGREEALVATYPSGIDVSSNYILIEPDGVSALKLFTRKGRYVADIGGVGQGPGEYKYAVNRFLDEKQGRVAIAENKKILFFDLKGQFLSEESISLPETITKSCIWID